ncbi:MAG: WGR domain-containing protein [Capsulimonas sp.]|uniref:WGR domain-containing protein n=1 Tax=Capsulimonas sp. TaxID=2494211 RepID=UPI003267BDE6
MTSTIHTSSRLFYRDGSSDKEYHAAINEAEGGYTVTFAFGRRGNALSAGTKTNTPVTLEKARQIYDKLISEKTSKGYTPDGSGALFAMTENAARISGLVPQLLNSIEEEHARRHIEDNAWCLQEKFDGKRIMASVASGAVTGSNRKGLCVSMPQEISDALALIPDCVLDGELLGDKYVLFDLLAQGADDLRSQPYRKRFEALRAIVGNTPFLSVAETSWNQVEKQALYDTIAARGGEGVVFKKADGVSVAGRPASGGSQVKCKFYATCTCEVAAVNDQRSVRLQLFDEAGAPIAVGSVTIPVNKPVPAAGALVEIRYLYAYKGGSLYQPSYLGERDDLSRIDCAISQLKYKPEGKQTEDEEG